MAMFFIRGFLNFLAIYFKRPKFLLMTAILAFAITVVSAVYGVRAVHDIPVYVVDHDNSMVSRSIRLFLDSGPDLKILGSLESLDEAKAHLYEGDAVAVIYIPAGTSEAIKTQSGARVISYIDGTNMLMAKNADKAIMTVVKSASVGITMIALNKQGMAKQSLMGALQAINLDIERPFNAMTIYSEYILPVLIFFNLNIFTCVMTCACFQEKLPAKIEERTYRRRFFVMGRLLAVFVAAMIFGLVIYIVALPSIDIVVQASTAMTLGSLAIYVGLTMMLFTSINLMFPIPVSMSLSYLTCMLSVMFSGLTWPLESMPWYIQEISSWIPMTPFLQTVQIYLYHDVKWEDLIFFYNMFFKQAILYACTIFVLMRCRDIFYVHRALWRRHKSKKQLVLAAEGGVAIPVDVSEPDVNGKAAGQAPAGGVVDTEGQDNTAAVGQDNATAVEAQPGDIRTGEES